MIRGGNDAAGINKDRRPNLLWIMTDQQPISTIRAYGNERVQTPNMDSIAANGVRFDNFYIVGFPCSPSRASFLTGLLPHAHGVFTNNIPLDDKMVCLGDILKVHGYSTAYIGKWHLSGYMYRGIKGRKPFDGLWRYKVIPDPEEGVRLEKVPGGTGEDEPVHGFTDRWVGGWRHFKEYLTRVGLGELVERHPGLGNHNMLPSAPEGKHMYSKLPQEHHEAAFLSREAAQFIREHADGSRPFCVVLSIYGPHLPVAPPKPWDEMYDPKEVPLPSNFHDELIGKPRSQRLNKLCYRLPTWKEEQFRDYIARYWGYVSYIDHQIGEVLRTLEETGRMQDTIVLFTSDHGDMVGAHGMIFKLRCGYDELMRVPFMIRYDGTLPRGVVCEALVSSVDVLPSLLELMGIPAPSGLQGRSFIPLLRGKRERIHDAVFTEILSTIIVRTDRWKFCLNWRPRDLDELYDLRNDPGEMHNLAYEPEYAGVIEDMRRMIAEWLEETDHPFGELIMKAAAKRVEYYDVWPEVTDFKHLGDDRFSIGWVWHVEDELPRDLKYWTFVHFTNRRYGRDGDIAFRVVKWPNMPTTEWRKGSTVKMGPFEVQVPEHCGDGEYAVRVGLYNPDVHKGLQLMRGPSNYVEVGKLTIRRTEEGVRKMKFEPLEPRSPSP
jgi:arylsulfatase A-like enzyme